MRETRTDSGETVSTLAPEPNTVLGSLLHPTNLPLLWFPTGRDACQNPGGAVSRTYKEKLIRAMQRSDCGISKWATFILLPGKSCWPAAGIMISIEPPDVSSLGSVSGAGRCTAKLLSFPGHSHPVNKQEEGMKTRPFWTNSRLVCQAIFILELAARLAKAEMWNGQGYFSSVQLTSSSFLSNL